MVANVTRRCLVFFVDSIKNRSNFEYHKERLTGSVLDGVWRVSSLIAVEMSV